MLYSCWTGRNPSKRWKVKSSLMWCWSWGSTARSNHQYCNLQSSRERRCTAARCGSVLIKPPAPHRLEMWSFSKDCCWIISYPSSCLPWWPASNIRQAVCLLNCEKKRKKKQIQELFCSQIFGDLKLASDFWLRSPSTDLQLVQMC